MEDPILALREASNSTLNTQHVASTTAMTSTTRSSSSLSVLEEDSKHIEAQSSPLIMRSTEGNPDFVRKLRLCTYCRSTAYRTPSVSEVRYKLLTNFKLLRTTLISKISFLHESHLTHRLARLLVHQKRRLLKMRLVHL